MSELEISRHEDILKYPDIIAQIREKQITLDQIRYVRIKIKPSDYPRSASSLSKPGKIKKDIDVTVVLHDNQRIPLNLEQLIYNAKGPADEWQERIQQLEQLVREQSALLQECWSDIESEWGLNQQLLRDIEAMQERAKALLGE